MKYILGLLLIVSNAFAKDMTGNYVGEMHLSINEAYGFTPAQNPQTLKYKILKKDGEFKLKFSNSKKLLSVSLKYTDYLNFYQAGSWKDNTGKGTCDWEELIIFENFTKSSASLIYQQITDCSDGSSVTRIGEAQMKRTKIRKK